MGGNGKCRFQDLPIHESVVRGTGDNEKIGSNKTWAGRVRCERNLNDVQGEESVGGGKHCVRCYARMQSVYLMKAFHHGTLERALGGNPGLPVGAMNLVKVGTSPGGNGQGMDLHDEAVMSWHNQPSLKLLQRHRMPHAAGFEDVGIRSRIGAVAGSESKDHVAVGCFCWRLLTAEGRRGPVTMDGGTGKLEVEHREEDQRTLNRKGR
jgi:hypothetical protein